VELADLSVSEIGAPQHSKVDWRQLPTSDRNNAPAFLVKLGRKGARFRSVRQTEILFGYIWTAKIYFADTIMD
jgi:hypothetical protein